MSILSPEFRGIMFARSISARFFNTYSLKDRLALKKQNRYNTVKTKMIFK